MAKYSVQFDVNDELINQFSKRTDHDEAEEYVDKILSKIGIDPITIVGTPLLKRLSVAYATYKRAFYESKTKDDLFYRKYLDYEKELRELTQEVVKDYSKKLTACNKCEHYKPCENREFANLDRCSGKTTARFDHAKGEFVEELEYCDKLNLSGNCEYFKELL